MFNKAKLNFVVDAVILVAFLAATVSGVVLLTAPHGGIPGRSQPLLRTDGALPDA